MNGYQEAAAIVRREDKDRYLADLFAPERGRGHLFALHAFNAEVARVRDAITNPIAGEIRLQWWRDTIATGEPSGHPVAAALVETIKAASLPVAAFDNLLKARIFDLYDDPMPDVPTLEGYLGDTASALIQLGAIALNGGTDPGSADAAGHAGVAYGLTGLMRSLPYAASRRQLFLPADVLARHGVDMEQMFAGQRSRGLDEALAELRGLARRHLDLARAAISHVAPAALPAFLPLALAEPYLKRMERADHDPLRVAVEIPQWRRQLILWRAARSGKI
jgi:phytoene synthase